MDCFKPGAEYGNPYQHFFWVCTNPLERSFEKCSLQEGQAVWRALCHKVQTSGLGKTTFVFNSGCLLGCKKEGTTVALYSKSQLQFFHRVTLSDVDTLIKLVNPEVE